MDNIYKIHKMKKLIAAARGDIKSEKVIKGARIANVFSFEFEEADVAIVGDTIVGVGTRYDAEEIIDASGCIITPGLIDGHIHIESSFLTPSSFAEAVIPHGTTSVFVDPHEIANVAGLEGIIAMTKSTTNLPMDFYFGVPSCVPASNFETCRHSIEAVDITEMLESGICHHLGEMMNFPAVIRGDKSVLRKIIAANAFNRPKPAHAPLVSGKELCAYLISGCDADHESSFYFEAIEKLRRGMWVMIRQGSTARNLEPLLEILKENPNRASLCMVVSDDLSVESILEHGHQDMKIRMMINTGIDPLIALRLVTLSPSQYFGIGRVGGIAPGWKADLVIVDSLESFNVKKVFKNGNLIVDNAELRVSLSGFSFPDIPKNKLVDLKPSDIKIPIGDRSYDNPIRVIGTEKGALLTRELIMRPTIIDGHVVADPERDISKLVVQERHIGSGRVGVGFVKGLGIKKGALASSIAHDSHNFIAAGADDISILSAMEWLRINEGGVVVSEGNDILANLQLPIGGLMSNESASSVADSLRQVEEAAASIGITGNHACMVLSFLSLSVIPKIKLTDKGYVSITENAVLDLFVSQ
ncbi:MAG: adenine deaminase [Synergistaceae bacterium]|nr:adenine deaminase [Synergistaceae bacterium]